MPRHTILQHPTRLTLSAVHPLPSLASMSAPASSKTFTASALPPLAAACSRADPDIKSITPLFTRSGDSDRTACGRANKGCYSGHQGSTTSDERSNPGHCPECYKANLCSARNGAMTRSAPSSYVQLAHLQLPNVAGCRGLTGGYDSLLLSRLHLPQLAKHRRDLQRA